MTTRGEKVCQFIERYGLIPDGSKVGQPIKLFDQGYITFDASGTLVLSDECPPDDPHAVGVRRQDWRKIN